MDSIPAESTVTNITVVVVDVDDQPASFNYPEYTFIVPEDTRKCGMRAAMNKGSFGTRFLIN